MNLTILNDYGIDYEKGLARCMDDRGLYESILLLFLEDAAMPRARKSFNDKNYTELFRSLHELKGACGNAEMTELYNATYPLVELLRVKGGTDEEIAGMYALVETAYNKAKEGIIAAGKK